MAIRFTHVVANLLCIFFSCVFTMADILLGAIPYILLGLPPLGFSEPVVNWLYEKREEIIE